MITHLNKPCLLEYIVQSRESTQDGIWDGPSTQGGYSEEFWEQDNSQWGFSEHTPIQISPIDKSNSNKDSSD